jgi:hypothetical protein
MPKQQKSATTSRLFTSSLKPAWNKQKIEKFLNDYQGTFQAWIINHDKDTNADGEIIENHTHLVNEYDTPRKLTSVANLLQCETNFVEYGKSKKALLRYLTHKDETDKFKYADEEVFTNADAPYHEQVLANNLSDKEIAEYIKEGKGTDLLGVVNISKLRTIQAFLQYDRTGQIAKQLKDVGEKLETLNTSILNIETMATNLVKGATKTMEQMTTGIIRIADEAKLARLKANAKR